jgi:hypothetical protein
MRTETHDTGRAVVRTLLRRAATLAHVWRKLTAEPYRPEKHYMRGPGPKWREKHGPAGSR